MLTLHINGEQKQFPPDLSIAQLVATMSLAGKRFAVELNGEIVPRSGHATRHCAMATSLRWWLP